MNVTFTLAFIAGLVSFLSPCVLPLVPAYIGYMSGRVTNTVSAQSISMGRGGAAVMTRPTLASRFSTFTHGLAFVLGFTLVFVSIGLITTAFVSVIGRQNVNAITEVVSRAGGVIIIFFGLHFMGVIPSLFRRLQANKTLISSPITGLILLILASLIMLWALVDWLIALPFIAMLGLWLYLSGAFTMPEAFWNKTISALQTMLYADTRREMVANGKQGYLSSVIMGVVFSAGWTPCIGPIYGSILTMAATGGSVSDAGLLLTAYSLGLGIPFLTAALLLDSAQSALRRLQRHIHKIELLSGAFLVIIGVLVATGNLQRLSQNFATTFADFSYNLEDCVVKVSQGQLSFGELPACINGVATSGEPADDPVGAVPTAAAPAVSQLPGISDLAESAALTGLDVGDLAPDFASMDETGVLFNLSDHRGEIVLLNFWATWCGPCRVEMPDFEAAYQASAARGLTIIGVNNGETPETVSAFRAEQAVTYPFVMDQRAVIQDLYAISGYPTSYLIGRDGVILARSQGVLTAEQIDQWVTDALSS